MAQMIDMKAIRKLSVAERYALIARIWDTLADDDEIQVSERVMAEMERRLAEFDADPSIGISHKEMMRRLRKMM